MEETWDAGGKGSGAVGTQPGTCLITTRNGQTRATASDYKLGVLEAHFWGFCLDFP